MTYWRSTFSRSGRKNQILIRPPFRIARTSQGLQAAIHNGIHRGYIVIREHLAQPFVCATQAKIRLGMQDLSTLPSELILDPGATIFES
jgi:hypothetical protein